jgi:hypothetical protein
VRRLCRSPIGLLSAVVAALLPAGCVTHTVESRAYQTEVRVSVPGALARVRASGEGAETSTGTITALPGKVSAVVDVGVPDCTSPGLVMGSGIVMTLSAPAAIFGGLFLASVSEDPGPGSSGSTGGNGGAGLFFGGVTLALVGVAAILGGARALVLCNDEAETPAVVGTRPTTVVVERSGYRPQSIVVEHPAPTVDVILSPAWRVATASAALDVYATSDERRPGLHALGRRVAVAIAAERGLGADAVVEGSPATTGVAQTLAVRVFTASTAETTSRCLVRVERGGVRVAELESGCEEAALAAVAEQAALDALRGTP